MKTIKNTKKRLSTILLPLFAFMLVLSTVLPSVASASTGTPIVVESEIKVYGGTKFITAEKIEKMNTATSDKIEIVLTLTDNEWAHDINTNEEKRKMIVAGMTAGTDMNEWETYKAKINTGTPTDVSVDSSNKNLTVTLPKAASYNISNNQTITMNLSGALIQNWPGQVTPVEFTIYAKPQISLGGTITSSTTVDDIIKGGKMIELNLVNATWNDTMINNLTDLNGILKGFKSNLVDGIIWEVTQHIINQVDPNSVVTYTNDHQTLNIELPPFPTPPTIGSVAFDPTVLNLGQDINVNNILIDTEVAGETLTPVLSKMGFVIGASNTSSIELVTNDAMAPGEIKEANVFTGGVAKITLTLTGKAVWDKDITDINNQLTDEKKEALIDALITANEPEQWEKVKDALSSTNVTRIGDKIVEIDIPAVNDYYLTADQKISLTVPHQLLVNDVDLNTVDFTVKATQKTLIKGSVTEGVSQADIIKGNETIIVELVNAKWADNIGTSTVAREELLKRFDWGTTPNPSNIKSIINTGAVVERVDDNFVTISLPPIPGFKITGKSQDVKYIDTTFPAHPDYDSFPITAVTNQTATISGSILSKTNEFDIVTGKKEIIITLKNDIWAKDIATNTAKAQELMAGFKLKDAAGSTSGSASVKKDGITPATLFTGNVVRTSDTVVTITLNPNSTFSLKADATATLDITATLLSVSSAGIQDKDISTFKIAAVTAELPNKADLTLDKSDIQNGGKTITITLKNAVFADGLSNNINAVIDGLSINSGSNWTMIKNELKNNQKNIKISKDKMTIKLPPVPNYNSNAAETIKLKIPSAWIKESPQTPAVNELEVAGDILLGAVATATLNTPLIKESDIKKTVGNFQIKITLSGTQWDPAIMSNKSKQSTLAKGFTTKDQTKEWALITKAMASPSTTYGLSGTKNEILTITLPAVPDYTIIRDQEVDIKIPKSVLLDYKTDIEVNGKLKIEASKAAAGTKSLGDLTAVELADAIATNKRVIVPNKKVETIFVNTVELPSSDKVKPSITTIEVTTTSDVLTVDIIIPGQTLEKVSKVGNKSTVVYKNLPKNSELKVSVFGTDKAKPLQTPIYKKIGNGSKTYNEIPKKDYTGSYLVYDILTDKSLLKEILKYYSIEELKVTN